MINHIPALQPHEYVIDSHQCGSSKSANYQYVTAALASDIHAQAKAVAARHGVTVSGLVRAALVKALGEIQAADRLKEKANNG